MSRRSSITSCIYFNFSCLRLWNAHRSEVSLVLTLGALKMAPKAPSKMVAYVAGKLRSSQRNMLKRSAQRRGLKFMSVLVADA